MPSSGKLAAADPGGHRVGIHAPQPELVARHLAIDDEASLIEAEYLAPVAASSNKDKGDPRRRPPEVHRARLS